MVCAEQNCVPPPCGGFDGTGQPATCGMLALSANEAAPSPLMFGNPPVAFRKLITCVSSICERITHIAISARLIVSNGWKFVQAMVAPEIIPPELVPTGGGITGGLG